MDTMTESAADRLRDAAREFIVAAVGEDLGAGMTKQAEDFVTHLVESGVVAAIKAEALREAGTAVAAHGQVRMETWLYQRADALEGQ